ncbi:MAG TPA: hypothetical protein VLF39_01370 [Candidatus Saccharimonadales bacterium]|nr:hypothetical protein [Candidatus Saccharimonadales bacterium]
MEGKTLDEMTKHEDRARHDLLAAGEQIGNAVKDALVYTNAPFQLHIEVGRRVIEAIDKDQIHKNLGQGVWYGLGIDMPMSQVRELKS